MYDTRFKGSFKAVPIYVYKPHSIRKRTLGSISCMTTTFRPLQLIPFNWVPLESLQDSDLSSEAIGPHWPSSYPDHLSPCWDKDEQRRVVWSRLRELRTLASQKPSKQTELYHALCQEYQKTQVESSHDVTSLIIFFLSQTSHPDSKLTLLTWVIVTLTHESLWL